MKRLLVVFMAVLLLAGFVSVSVAQQSEGFAPNSPAFAGAKVMTAEGTVVAHDVACHCLVLKTSKGDMTFNDDYAKFDQEYNRAKGLKVGSKATVQYKAISGINYAMEIHQ